MTTTDGIFTARLAKRLAKSKQHNHLRQAYADYTGCTTRTACAAADYLKGYITFQEYCDIKHDEGDK